MFYGHTDTVHLFQKLVDTQKLSQSYLFFGDEGIGKLLFARSLASYLETGAWDAPRDPLIDFREFRPAEDKFSIGIDDVRALRGFLWNTPLKSSRRIALINDAHLLTPEAQSAMLKIVEEPPVHSLIILISYDPSVFSAPLLSRLSKIYFRRFSENAISAFLEKHKGVPEHRARSIAKQSHGRIGRACALLDTRTSEENGFDMADVICSLFDEGVLKNAEKLSWLLKKESDMKQFRLNRELQRRSVQTFLL